MSSSSPHSSSPASLHLPHQTLDRLSGPASMYYLRPDPIRQLAFYQAGIALPLVLLWGDVHRSMEGMCEPCDSETCRTIYDPALLQSIDHLAAEYPIDFYTEHHRETPRPYHNPQNVLFYHFISELTQPCHDTATRTHPTTTTTCPTQYIRWHYADIRQNYDAIESHVLHPLYIIYPLLEDALKKPPVTDSASTLLRWMEKTSGAYLDPSSPTYPTAYPASTPSRIALRQQGTALQNELLRILFYPIPTQKQLAALRIPSPTYPYRTVQDKYRDLLDVFLTAMKANKDSILFKQIRKMPMNELNDVPTLIDLILPHLVKHNSRMFTVLEAELQPLPPSIRMFLYAFFTNNRALLQEFRVGKGNKTLFTEQYNKGLLLTMTRLAYHLTDTVLVLHSYVVEFYTLLRMLKPPKGSSPPALVLGFFGGSHANMLVNWLVHPPFGYKIEFQHLLSFNPVQRCIPITRRIDLVRDLKEHVETVESLYESQEEEEEKHKHNSFYRPYRNTIGREEEARTAHQLMSLPNPYEGGKRNGKRLQRATNRRLQRTKRSRKLRHG